LVPSSTAGFWWIWQIFWQKLRCRIGVEQVGIRGNRTTQRVHMHDALIGDVNHDGDSDRCTGASHDVAPWNDPGRVRGLVEKRPWQAGLVHRL
jgi:hypothetical protein